MSDDLGKLGKAVRVEPKATVRETTQLMTDEDVGAVAVIEGDRLCGVFTERDLIQRVVSKGLDPETTPVSEVMTKDVQCLCSQAGTQEAIKALLMNQFRHLPVCDGEGHVVAVISSRHLLKAEIHRLGIEVDALESFLSADGPGG